MRLEIAPNASADRGGHPWHTTRAPSKTMRPQVGQLVNNKYRLVRLLGDGGMGSVFEAKHEILGSSVALKFLHPELARRQGLVQRFLQEARVSATIQSQHVVRVTDVEQTTEGLPFMVMEFLSGKSLQALYEELYRAGKRLSFEDAVSYAMQILDGLEAAHEEGVVHRDLKPDNVMIVTGKRGEALVKLLDFGIAKLKINGELYKGLTRPGVIMGTPEYMAPEQVFSADQVDARADIFSCGVMFFEMFAGRRPVGGEEAHQIAAQYLSGNVAKLSDLAPHVPQGLVDAVHRAMAADPKARFSSVLEMRAAMAPFTQGTTRAATSTPPPVAAASPVAAATPGVDGGATERVSEPFRGSSPPVTDERAAEYAAISARLKGAASDRAGEFDATVEGAPYQAGATEAFQPLEPHRPGGTDVGGLAPMPGAYSPAAMTPGSLGAQAHAVSAAPVAAARKKKRGLGLGTILLLGGAVAAMVTGAVYAVDQLGRDSDDSKGKSTKTVPLPTPKQASTQADPDPIDPDPQPQTQPQPQPQPQPTPTPTTDKTASTKPVPTTKPSSTTTKPGPGPWVIPSSLPGVPTTFPTLPPEWNIPGLPGGQSPQPKQQNPGQPKLEPIPTTGAVEPPAPTKADPPTTTERPKLERPGRQASRLPTLQRPTSTKRPAAEAQKRPTARPDLKIKKLPGR